MRLQFHRTASKAARPEARRPSVTTLIPGGLSSRLFAHETAAGLALLREVLLF